MWGFSPVGKTQNVGFDYSGAITSINIFLNCEVLNNTNLSNLQFIICVKEDN